MNCIIVEDEYHAAEHLELMLLRSGRPVEVVARIDSVKKTVAWLKQHSTDLIFLDIQLHNDLCFEIFDHVQVTTPVIFTTSYNQYAIKSFEVNNLSYLLKPIEADFLHAALDKYHLLYPEDVVAVHEKINALQTGYQQRFLVQSGKGTKSIPVEDVAYIKVYKNYVVVTTRTAQQYVIGSTLDALEKRLDPFLFFRINRQFIIGIDAIDTMYSLGKGRIKIETMPPCREEIIVGMEKAPGFRNWLNR